MSKKKEIDYRQKTRDMGMLKFDVEKTVQYRRSGAEYGMSVAND